MIKEFIYFITDGKFVKIGISKDPEKRLNNIQTANPQVVTIAHQFVGDVFLEKFLHDLFKEYHVKGEWFEYAGNLKTFIDCQFTITSSNVEECVKLDDIVPDGDSKLPMDHQISIVKGIITHQSSMNLPIMLEKVVFEGASDGLSEFDVNRIINYLENRGAIFQPFKGAYKIVE